MYFKITSQYNAVERAAALAKVQISQPFDPAKMVAFQQDQSLWILPAMAYLAYQRVGALPENCQPAVIDTSKLHELLNTHNTILYGSVNCYSDKQVLTSATAFVLGGVSWKDAATGVELQLTDRLTPIMYVTKAGKDRCTMLFNDKLIQVLGDINITHPHFVYRELPSDT